MPPPLSFIPVRTRIAIGAALALLLAGPAGAGSPEASCENAKLLAAGSYTSCLFRIVTWFGAVSEAKVQMHGPWVEYQIALCGKAFDRAFAQAEAGGACRTPGGPSTLREPIKAQFFRTADTLSNVANCTVTPGKTAVCVLSNTTTALDLGGLVSQLSGFGVTSATTFWVEAWGGDGGNGNVCCTFGGPGGTGGYAQMMTTLNAFENTFGGQQDIYYYLGFNGTSGADAGGDGGTTTLVTVNDLSESDVTVKSTLVLAGGGGGGGAGRGSKYACNGGDYVWGETGGDGGVAIAQSVSAIVPGKDGSDGYGTGRSGQGGQPTQGGAEGFGFGSDTSGNGGNPTAPLGGVGGMHSDPQVGFVNALASDLRLSGAGGQGQGNSPYDAGGGGGGGGYTGGGGGVRGFGDSCVSGAGGGGSSYAQTLPNSPTCSAAPTERPSNPAGNEGYIQITFDLGACE